MTLEDDEMVKIDLITGFLGAGKTTFIKKYARYLMENGNNIGILENDFGAVNVDMMLLQDLMGDNCELEMISGGCDRECHRRRFKTKLIAMGMCGYDRVIVEPSGVFDVEEFFDILHEEPLDRWYQIGNVIAIVDARLEDDLSERARFILASEVADAGCVVMSKSQNASDEEIENTVECINAALEKIRCSRRFSLADHETGSVKTDLGRPIYKQDRNETKNRVIHKNWDEMSKEDMDLLASCGYVTVSYRKPEFEAEEAFTSLYFMDINMTETQLYDAVKKIFGDTSCGHVMRIKGFIRDGTKKWLELNATKHEITLHPLSAGQEVLIVIGENLEEERIKSYISEADAVRER